MNKTLDETAVAAAWNRNAAQWTKDVRGGFDLYRTLYTLPAFLEFMPAIENKKTLDLGCGEGSNTRIFAQRGGNMTGVDLSERLLEFAQQEENASPLGIRYEQISFANLSIFANESFDCAVSTLALMDGPDFPAAMHEAYRVLRPGGLLSFSVLHPCFVTPAIQWIQDADSKYTGLRVGHYFEHSAFVEHRSFNKLPRPSEEPVLPFEVPRFPRTLSDYLNAVSGAGFRITKLAEPRPDPTLSEQHPWLARWYQHAPLVLFVEAAK